MKKMAPKQLGSKKHFNSVPLFAVQMFVTLSLDDIVLKNKTHNRFVLCPSKTFVNITQIKK